MTILKREFLFKDAGVIHGYNLNNTVVIRHDNNYHLADCETDVPNKSILGEILRALIYSKHSCVEGYTQDRMTRKEVLIQLENGKEFEFNSNDMWIKLSRGINITNKNIHKVRYKKPTAYEYYRAYNSIDEAKHMIGKTLLLSTDENESLIKVCKIRRRKLDGSIYIDQFNATSVLKQYHENDNNMIYGIQIQKDEYDKIKLRSNKSVIKIPKPMD